jgi:hypothetical protein
MGCGGVELGVGWGVAENGRGGGAFYRASEGAERSAGGLRWGALMAAGRYGEGNGRRRGTVDSMEKPKVVTRRFDSTPGIVR